jgi:molecular chaperone GrpE
VSDEHPSEQPPEPSDVPELAVEDVLDEAEGIEGEGAGQDPDDEPAGLALPDDVAEGDVIEGEIVEPSGSAAAEADALLAEALDAESIEAQFEAAEAALTTAGVDQAVTSLTADLQRVHAEYANYRKRVERDRELVRERAAEAVLVELLPILDDVGRARAHGELLGGFRSVGEALEALVVRMGMQPFGAVGEPFDPTRHEALMREEREGITDPTVVTVLQVGYLMNGRVVRPARVSVAGTD